MTNTAQLADKLQHKTTKYLHAFNSLDPLTQYRKTTATSK